MPRPRFTIRRWLLVPLVIALFFGLQDAAPRAPARGALIASMVSSIGPVAIVLTARTLGQSLVALAAVAASLVMILLGTIATYSPSPIVVGPCMLVLVGVGLAFVLYSHRIWTDVQSLRATPDEIRYLPRPGEGSGNSGGTGRDAFLPDEE